MDKTAEMDKTEAREAVDAAPLEERFRNGMPVLAAATGVNRSTDQVSQAMRAYVESGRISAEDHASLVWFFHHCKTERGYTSFDDFGRLIDYSGSTASRLFAGKYVGDVGEAVKKVANYCHLNAERRKMAGDVFVETSVWESVRSACDFAITYNRPVRVIGDTQIGKTFCFREYMRRAKCTVFYMQVPAAPSFRLFMRTLSATCGLPGSLREEELRARVPKALSEQTLLIVDELHRLATSAGTGTALRCAEWLREVWDASGCGLVLCGTRTMEDDLFGGAGTRGWLRQFDMRCIRTCVLPRSVPMEDVALFAAAYGLPPPRREDGNLLSAMPTNRLCVCLKLAGVLAKNRARRGGDPRATWDDFTAAFRHNFGKGA